MSEINYTDVRTQEMVENLLSIGETTITFTKTDGTERVMRCTLSESLIPLESAPKGDSTRKQSNEIRRVYDLDSNGWRSFRWDSIIEVSV